MSAHDEKPSEQFISELTSSQATLFAFILSLLPDREAARDALQETNIAIWRKSGDFTEGTNFLAWACRIARYEVLVEHRRRQKDRHLFVDETMYDKVAVVAERMAHGHDERLEALAECVEELPEKQRTLIRGRYEPGGSVAELSEQRDQPAASISVTLTRIRRRLLDCVRRKLAREARQ